MRSKIAVCLMSGVLDEALFMLRFAKRQVFSIYFAHDMSRDISNLGTRRRRTGVESHAFQSDDRKLLMEGP